MMHACFVRFLAVLGCGFSATALFGADLAPIPLDLTVPEIVAGDPAPGQRVKQFNPEYAGTRVYHTLFLPADWERGKTFPVICEYPGNGPYRNELGDTNSGQLEDCHLGYGISGGRKFIWVCLPFVNRQQQEHQLQWWGDADATVAYCQETVERVCRDFGGDRSALILAGFSRGAIACNYIGLRDDAIAGLWLAFVAHSHYDGVRKWPYADSDRPSALLRLERLCGRPQFITHETSVAETRDYLQQSGVPGDFTFVSLPFPNHTDSWVLRDLPERRQLRQWVDDILNRRKRIDVDIRP